MIKILTDFIQRMFGQLFKQKKSLNDADRQLASKQPKKISEEKRIATDKVQKHLDWLADLKRTELTKETCS